MTFTSRFASLVSPRGRLRNKGVRRNRSLGVNREAFFEPLEARLNLSAAFPEFLDPHPAAGNVFGAVVLPLSTGNVVITSPYDDAAGTDSGAVYLFNGATGTLISTLRGTHANDMIGRDGVTALTNGNYVIRSTNWDSGFDADAGAVTWGSGTTGISGTVSASNSLVGSTAGDRIGTSGVVALVNGNYVVASPNWDNDTLADAGAATWGSGTTGVVGAISGVNSLVGTKAYQNIGIQGVVALTNGNYVVSSPNWINDSNNLVGAVTWGNGTTGIVGAVSSSNSLVGTTLGDRLGSSGVTALTNGNYVVSSPMWDNGNFGDAGAVTFGSGTTGITGTVTIFNSLVGGETNNSVGISGVTALTNGNYVVGSRLWDHGTFVNVGAATWGSGEFGIAGTVSASNSLVGSTSNDSVGISITALANGNYVVRSSSWDKGTVQNAGAATWGSGTTGIVGEVSAANSLVGGATGDSVSGGGVTALTNGNYVVLSPSWDRGTILDVGAATWGSGTTGIVGVVSVANSLVGGAAGDAVSSSGVTALTNGNYVVRSPGWDNGSLVDLGAVTLGNGATGLIGSVGVVNSLYGGTTTDRVGSGSVTALSNGDYVVASPLWNNLLIASAGAVTWGSGTTGILGKVSPTNSLVGTTLNDLVGSYGPTALANGNYVVASPNWSNGAVAIAGAVTLGTGSGSIGTVTANNSAIGTTANSVLQGVVVDNVNNTFFARFVGEGGGRVRVGSQLSGFLNHAPTSIALSNSTIPENQPGGLPGTIVGTFGTTDQDPGDTFSYFLVPGTGSTDNSNFLIDVAGNLRAPFGFNYEARNSYSIRVRARDQGGLFLEQVFTISVTNVNEIPFLAMQDFSLPENTPNGAIVGTVVSTDLDAGDTKTFSITLGNSLGAFAISAAGVITVADSTQLDYDTTPGFYLQVKVTDAGGLSATNLVSVLLTNVNETPTNTTLSNSSISENRPIGAVIGAFTTSDPDHGNTFTYTLVSGVGSVDNASFSIDNLGILRSTASFDFETRSSYSIRVRSSDQGGLFVERAFTIGVLNLNEAPTVAVTSAAVTVDEGGIATNSGTFSDVEGNNTVTVTSSIGTLTQNHSDATWTWSLDAVDGPAGPFTVFITARDDQNAATIATFTYTVNNIAPTLSLSGSTAVDEGSLYLLHLGTVTDPGQDTIAGYQIHWGDGSIDSYLGNPANTTVTHVYADGPSTQSHSVLVTDEDGIDFLAGTLSVTVNNVAPVATLVTSSGATYGTAVIASFVDLFDPSTADMAAGLHFAFSLGSDSTASATYASSSSEPSADFGVLDAGSYPVYARVIDKDGGSSLYSTTITVNRANAVFSLQGYSITYDALAHTATGVATGVLGESLIGLDLSGTTRTNAIVPQIDTVTFTDVTGNYNNAILFVTNGIAKAHATITIIPYEGTYDAADHGLDGNAVGVAADLEAAGGTLILGAMFTDAPGGTAHWSFTGGANYLDESGDAPIVINKADAKFIIKPYVGITYDGEAHTSTVTVTGVGHVDLSAGLDLSGTTHIDAGTYNGDVWTFTGGTNYNDRSGTVVNRIDKADAVVAVTGYTGIYDAVVHELAGTATGVNGEPLVGLVLGSGRTNAGTSSVGWTFTGGLNYQDASGTQDIVIAQRPITVTADSQSKSTGQADPDLTYRITAGSMAGDDVLTGSLSREPGDVAGTYAILQGTLDAGSNYALSFTGANLVITVATSSLSGTVFVDFNDDGQVDFGEKGISGAIIHLTGTDDLGDAVDQVVQTDLDGAYVFRFLRPGNYRINETQPEGYTQGTNLVGTAGGTVSGDAFAVTLAADVTGLNYNFGERPAATGSIQQGQTAGIGFWNNKNGQALIKSLNDGPTSTQLGNWLALTLPNLYGESAGACSLAGKTNAQVAAFYQTRFVLKGTKVDAQVLATALSVYVTNLTLDSTRVAERYGFTVTQYGVGATGLFNVGSYGSVFGVANNTTLTVLDLLLSVNDRSSGGVLLKGDTLKRLIANLVFGLINEIGGI